MIRNKPLPADFQCTFFLGLKVACEAECWLPMAAAARADTLSAQQRTPPAPRPTSPRPERAGNNSARATARPDAILIRLIDSFSLTITDGLRPLAGTG